MLSLTSASCSVTQSLMLSLASASCFVTHGQFWIFHFSEFSTSCPNSHLVIKLYQFIITFPCSHFVHTVAPRNSRHLRCGIHSFKPSAPNSEQHRAREQDQCPPLKHHQRIWVQNCRGCRGRSTSFCGNDPKVDSRSAPKR